MRSFYNSLGLPIAAGVLYPWFGILLRPHYRRGGHELFLGVRGDQRFAPAAGATVMEGMQELEDLGGK